jgi:hypothetical protein
MEHTLDEMESVCGVHITFHSPQNGQTRSTDRRYLSYVPVPVPVPVPALVRAHPRTEDAGRLNSNRYELRARGTRTARRKFGHIPSMTWGR